MSVTPEHLLPLYKKSFDLFMRTAFEKEIELEVWQQEVVRVIEECIKNNRPVKIATSAGHGVGKTAFIAWVVLWFMITRESPQVIVTANTHIQLLSRTWKELAKWHSLFKFKYLFDYSPTRYTSKKSPSSAFAIAQTWNIARPEAFAGMHGEDILFIFDEASSIEQVIWDTVMGSMTSGNRFWLAFGNPTRNTGAFYNCFNPFTKYHPDRLQHLPLNQWFNFQVDSREVSFTDKEMLNDWVREYGEDSDVVRIRVKGCFPRQSINQLVNEEKISQAIGRHPYENTAPIVAGVDLASGTGENKTVVVIRQGCEVKAVLPIYLPIEHVHLKIGELVTQYRASIVCVDNVSIGISTYNLLKGMGLHVEGVNGGSPAMDKNKYHNRRTEVYFRMRDFLHEETSCIPKDAELIQQLCSVEYTFDNRERYMLISKATMRSKGIVSPDIADALAYTFAVSVPNMDVNAYRRNVNVNRTPTRDKHPNWAKEKYNLR